MAHVLPSYSAQPASHAPIIVDATTGARPTYEEIETSSPLDNEGRVPTYEGAIHGRLPDPEKVVSFLRLIDGLNNFLGDLERDNEGQYIYLATAEQRYIQFLKMRPHTDFIPPMDVAIIWLAHLSDPFRYFEDIFRSYQGMLDVEFPVTALAARFETKLLSNRVSEQWTDDKFAREIWETQTKSPYRLATNKETLENRVVMCPIPGQEDPDSVMFTAKQWALMMRYPEIALLHEETKRQFSAASISANRFLHNIRNNLVVKGSTLSDGSIDYTASLERQKRIFSFPELQEVLAMKDPTWDKIRLAMRFVIVKNKLVGTADESKPISWEVCHRGILTNLGLCLPAAVLRSQRAWRVLLKAQDIAVEETISQYKDFLSLFVNRRDILVPTTGLEIVLRCHLLMPQSYRAYTYGILGRHLAHDDTQSIEEFIFHLDTTRRLWSTMYPKAGPFDVASSAITKLKGKFGKKKMADISRQAYQGSLSSYELSFESMLPAAGTDVELREFQELLATIGLEAPPVAGRQPSSEDALFYSQISFGKRLTGSGRDTGSMTLDMLQTGKVRPHGMHVSHNAMGRGTMGGFGAAGGAS